MEGVEHMENDFDWLDQIIKEGQAAKQLRLDHPYVLDLIEVLKPYPTRGLARQSVLSKLEQNRKSEGLPIPQKFEESVQSTYNRYCVDSAVFVKRKAPVSEGLFFSPIGKGAGAWAVNVDRAKDWVKAKLDGIS